MNNFTAKMVRKHVRIDFLSTYLLIANFNILIDPSHLEEKPRFYMDEAISKTSMFNCFVMIVSTCTNEARHNLFVFLFVSFVRIWSFQLHFNFREWFNFDQYIFGNMWRCFCASNCNM